MFTFGTFGHDCPAIKHGLLENPLISFAMMMRLGERLWTRSFDASKMAYEAVRQGAPQLGNWGNGAVGSVPTVPINQKHGPEWLTKDEGCGYMEPLGVSKSCVSLIHPQDSPSVGSVEVLGIHSGGRCEVP